MAGEFVTDVKEIRRRARAPMEQGPQLSEPKKQEKR
jgi:hypothetical protein